MTDYEDYENNLAFPPTTDRTQSTIELVEKIEKLTNVLKEVKAYLSLDGYNRNQHRKDITGIIDQVLGN